MFPRSSLSLFEAFQFVALVITPCLWLRWVTASADVGGCIAIILLTLSACLWGRVIFLSFGLDSLFRRSLPIVYLTGILWNSLLMFLGKLVFPLPISVVFLVTLAVGAILHAKLHLRARQWSLPAKEWRDAVIVIWCLAAATWWLSFAMPEKVENSVGVYSRMFIEYYAHTVNFLPLLSDGTTFSYGSPHFAGENWSFYHLASYTPAALVARMGSARASETLVAIWYPMGLFLVGLSASVLTCAAFGHRYAIWGTLLVLAPDPTFWSWESLPYSFVRLAEAAPGVSGGITIGALSLSLLFRGTRAGHFCCTLLGMATSLLCLYFRSSYLFAIVPAAFYVLIFGRRRSMAWKMRMLAIYIMLVGGGFLLGKQLSSAPSMELSWRGGEPLALWVKDLLPPDSFLRGFVPGEAASEIPVSIGRRAIFLLLASFQGGLYVWAGMFLISILHGRERPSVTWFPVASLAVYLGVALFLGPNLNGDPFELQHRPFGWYYFLLASWTGSQLGRLLTRWRLPTDAIGCAIALVLLLPIHQLGQTVRNPFLYEEHMLPQGMLASVDYLRRHTAREDRFADSLKDPILVVTALSERPAFVCWRQNYTFPGQGALRDARVRRWEELDELLSSTTLEEIQSWRARHGVDWLLVHPGTKMSWPESLLARPVFESEGYRLYHLPDVTVSDR